MSASTSSAPSTEGPLITPGNAEWPSPTRAWSTICLIAFVTMLANIDRSVVNLLVEPMKADLQLSDTQVSLIIGLAFSTFYMLTGLPMSRVSDAKSRKWVLAGGLVVWSAATVACGFARNFVQLFIARGAVGAAESVPGPAAMSMISDLVPKEKLPRAFAVYSLGIGVGASSAMIIGGLLLGYFGKIGHVTIPLLGTFAPWQLVFIACGLPGIFVAIIWLFAVREPVRRDRIIAKGSVPIRDVLRYLGAHKAVYLPMFLSIAIGSIEIYGAMAWRVSMFARTYGWAPAQTGPLFGTMGLIIMPIPLLAGTWLAETLLKRGDPRAMLRVSVIASAFSLPFTVIAPLMPNGWLCFGMLGISTIIAGMSGPALNSAIQFVTPNEMRAQISSLYLYTISVVGTAMGPLVVALVTDFILKDESMLRYAMSGFAVVLGPIAIMLMWMAMRAYGTVMEARAAAGN